MNLLKTLFSIIVAYRTTAILEDEAIPGEMVWFHWSGKNQRAQIDEDVKRRARILNGSLAMIMERPHVSVLPNRVCIQAINDANVTLGVKLGCLQLVKPIKLHVFHALNMNSTNDEYLRKEVEIANNTDYFMALTVHPFTTTLLPDNIVNRVHIGNRMVSDFVEKDCFFLDDLHWFASQQSATDLDLDRSVNRLKDSVKSIISRFVQKQYKNAGNTTEIGMIAMSCPKRLENVLRIQLRAIQQGHMHMDWLPNDKVDMKLLLQFMIYIHLSTDVALRNAHQVLFQRHHDVIAGEYLPIREFLKIFNEERSSIEDEDFNEWNAKLHAFEANVPQVWTNSDIRMFLQNMRDLVRHLGIKVHRLRRTERSLRLALVLGGLDSDFRGKNIAMTIPGDFEDDREQMKESLLYMIYQLTGHPSSMEIHDI